MVTDGDRGALIDGIPESIVIGVSTIAGGAVGVLAPRRTSPDRPWTCNIFKENAPSGQIVPWNDRYK